MAHLWHKFKKTAHSVAKVAGGIGAIALAVHGIQKGSELHGQTNFSSHATAPRFDDASFRRLQEYRSQQIARNPNWANTV